MSQVPYRSGDPSALRKPQRSSHSTPDPIMFESLEQRTLMSASAVNPVMDISHDHLAIASADARIEEMRQRVDTPWTSAVNHAISNAINPDDHECGPTEFDFWIFDNLVNQPYFGDFLDIAIDFGVDLWPLFHSLLIDQDASDEFIGIEGEHTQEMVKRFRDNQQFWDIPSDDILLQGMHGSDIADDAKMIPVAQFLFGVDEEIAGLIVDHVQSVIEQEGGIGYDHPIFTLNAIAHSGRGEPEGSPFANVPDKIIMGDGIIQAIEDMGLGKNGPDTILAHEFAHHVQFELGLFDDYSTIPPEDLPEFTRKTEMMADGFGAYYAAHARGASIQINGVAEVLGTLYVVGDCAFDHPGHHGTPNQREAAARWGADLANAAQKQGMINSSATMLDEFEAVFPELIAPDAELAALLSAFDKSSDPDSDSSDETFDLFNSVPAEYSWQVRN